jgi:hypothetical protein
MKKFLLFFAIVHGLYTQAQTEKLINIRQMLVPFNGGNYNGLVADVEAPPELVEGVLKDNFAKQGVRPKEINGFLVFRNVILKSVDSVQPMDAFFKVEKKSRKEKEVSTISLIPAKHGDIPDEKIKSGSPTTVVTAAAVSGGVINSLTPEIEMKVYEKNLADKQDEIIRSEKKLKDLQDDQASFERKQKSLEDDIVLSKKEQEFEQANLERIRKEQGDTKKSEKKLKGLVDDQAGYEKKLVNLKQDLEKNKKDQEFERANLERLRKDLQDLIAKRPGGAKP